MDPRLQDAWERALADEGVLGTPLEQVARKTKGFESGGNPNAVSNRGATGWMQVMPATFKDVADQGWDINDPYFNARAGIRYLKKGWEASGGDVALTGAYYYGGPGGMEKARRGVAVSDPKNPNYPNTIQYGQRLAKAVESLFPSAHAGELPKQKDVTMNNPQQPPAPVNVNVKTTSVLPNALAALLGGYNGLGNAGGEFRSQDAAAMAPEAIASLQGMKETKARMLPLALGALMSSNSGANQFGQNIIGPAMSSLDPVKLNNGLITPDGQYVTDVDGSSIMRSMIAANKNTGPKTIGTGEISKFNDKLETLSQMKYLTDTFKDSFTPLIPSETIGNIQNTVGKKVGLGLEDQASFWMSYQSTINKIRNEMFGSALTDTERNEFEKSIVRPGMKPDVIKGNLEKQQLIIRNAIERQALMFSESGYNVSGLKSGIDRVLNPQVSNTQQAQGQTGGTNVKTNVSVPDVEEKSLDELMKIYGGKNG